MCELDRGHDGDHLPYVPGCYLPPPLITPLDLLHLAHWPLRTACLLCGRRVDAVSCDGPTLTFREGDGRGDVECEWRFGPCGCVGRELIALELNAA
ncbi:hypothetical protein [Streptomyces sp. NPDC020951]|uniref:hypothetical protein n=1 Tax=Streptomyces sp. NPDC020951 TaxID=3365104 RepID=UPI0037B299C7